MARSIFGLYGIRKKLIMYFLITIILMGLTSAFSYYSAKSVLKNTNKIITDYSYLNNLGNEVNNLMTELEKYLTSASSVNLLNYYSHYNKLQEIGMQIPRTTDYDYELLVLKDIGNMLDKLMVETDRAVQAKRGRISSSYIAYFERSNEICEYIRSYNNNLLDSKLKSGSMEYQRISENMNYIIYLNMVIIIAAIIINLFIAGISTYRLTKPISQLSQTAERISQGDFDVELTQTHTGDETDILAGAFIKMIKSIRIYIDELKRQAEFEKKLKEQEFHNLKINSLLKEAELKFLQSQINPHFLFNTLNAASQLAMIEGADNASQFIENIAQLFRYNLKSSEELVPLRDEIEYVKNYMQILKIRFGNRIQFISNIDEEALEVKIPRITIQPIVENAYIHGLQDLERIGEIHLNVRSKIDMVIIEITDNGMGMEKDFIDRILSQGTNENIEERHITGIGINNVLQRLGKLFNISDNKSLIDIESKIGLGTKVTLKIPKLLNS